MNSKPIHPRVWGSTAGAGVGFGCGKVVTKVLESFGIVTPDQGAALADAVDLACIAGFTFLGGWIRKSD